MKKIAVFLFIFTIPLVLLFPREMEFTLGGDNWQPFLLRNIEINRDAAGQNALFIQDGEHRVSNSTNLLLHFNSLPIVDAAGNFRVVESRATISTGRKRFGAGAAMFNGERNAIVLDRHGRGVFPGEIYSGDFSIEFWIFGRNFSDGETIFFIDSRTNTGRGFVPQLLRCYIKNRRVVWDIRNFFIPHGANELDLKISSVRQLVPNAWSHHLLRFDSSSGLLEYLIDGKPEAVAFVTATGREGSSVHPLHSGTNARIVIGDNFTGLLDEMRFKLEWVDPDSLPLLGSYRGVYISEPIDLGNSRSSVFAIETRSIIPANTDILYYYYLSDSRRSPSENSSGWRKFTPGNVNTAGGRFLSIKAILLSDGERNVSPSISRINVRFNQVGSPQPPRIVRAEPGNGSVRLRWSDVRDPNIDGFYVFFGERPGRYFGASGSNVTSPIDVGRNTEIVISNLENGRIYYFAVVSYIRTANRYGTAIINEGGDFSVEVSARPLDRHGDLR
ncbi:MAG: hypothetical protein FWC36_03115 [Spirochaetes bacterium]|nr:hypothetical protein [Spirochaetota bacterium]